MKHLRSTRRKIPWIEDWGGTASFGLLALGYSLQSFNVRTVAVMAYAVAAVLGLLAWWAHLRRYQLIHNTPTSRIAAAAQGYVELDGRAQAVDGRLAHSALTQTPCLWYRSQAWYRQPGAEKRGFVEHESDALFMLVDAEGRGQCLVDPHGAEFFVMRKSQWRVPPGTSSHSDEFIEWILLPGDPIHVLGEFSTASEDSTDRVSKPRFGQPYLIGNIPGRYLAWRHMGLSLLNLLMMFANLWLLERIGLLPF